MSKRPIRLINDYSVPEKIVVTEGSAFKSARFTFNFSFATREKAYNFTSQHFDKLVKNKFVEKLIRLSTADVVTVMGWPKQTGLEKLADTDVRLSINPEFIQSGRHEACVAGLWIFRLAKSGRVVGKINGTVFYVLAVDTKFDLYHHG